MNMGGWAMRMWSKVVEGGMYVIYYTCVIQGIPLCGQVLTKIITPSHYSISSAGKWIFRR